MTFVAEDNAPGGPRVAVLGLGTMGAGMARSLLRAGLPIDVWNRTPERAAGLATRGAAAHADPADAVAGAGVVITMLADATAVRSVALDQGMLDALRPGAIWAQMGTIGVAATEELAAVTAEHRPDVAFVDAPVSAAALRPKRVNWRSWPQARSRCGPPWSRCSARWGRRPGGWARSRARPAVSSWS